MRYFVQILEVKRHGGRQDLLIKGWDNFGDFQKEDYGDKERFLSWLASHQMDVQDQRSEHVFDIFTYDPLEPRQPAWE